MQLKGFILSLCFGCALLSYVFLLCGRYGTDEVVAAVLLKAEHHVSSSVVDVSNLTKCRYYYLWPSAHKKKLYRAQKNAPIFKSHSPGYLIFSLFINSFIEPSHS